MDMALPIQSIKVSSLFRHFVLLQAHSGLFTHKYISNWVYGKPRDAGTAGTSGNQELKMAIWCVCLEDQHAHATSIPGWKIDTILEKIFKQWAKRIVKGQRQVIMYLCWGDSVLEVYLPSQQCLNVPSLELPAKLLAWNTGLLVSFWVHSICCYYIWSVNCPDYFLSKFFNWTSTNTSAWMQLSSLWVLILPQGKTFKSKEAKRTHFMYVRYTHLCTYASP